MAIFGRVPLGKRGLTAALRGSRLPG